MKEKEPKLEEPGKEIKPIIDIEVNKATLESWEKQGLNNNISTLVDGDFERFVLPGERFVLSPDNFSCTDDFIKHAEHGFSKFKAENLDEKMEEVKNQTRKAILNFTFKELGVDSNNPEIIKQETIKQDGKELTIKHFKTNQPRIALASDNIDWWLERGE